MENNNKIIAPSQQPKVEKTVRVNDSKQAQEKILSWQAVDVYIGEKKVEGIISIHYPLD